MVEVFLKNKEVAVGNELAINDDIPFIILKTNSDFILINMDEISIIKVNESELSLH